MLSWPESTHRNEHLLHLPPSRRPLRCRLVDEINQRCSSFQNLVHSAAVGRLPLKCGSFALGRGCHQDRVGNLRGNPASPQLFSYLFLQEIRHCAEGAVHLSIARTLSPSLHQRFIEEDVAADKSTRSSLREQQYSSSAERDVVGVRRSLLP